MEYSNTIQNSLPDFMNKSPDGARFLRKKLIRSISRATIVRGFKPNVKNLEHLMQLAEVELFLEISGIKLNSEPKQIAFLVQLERALHNYNLT